MIGTMPNTFIAIVCYVLGQAHHLVTGERESSVGTRRHAKGCARCGVTWARAKPAPASAACRAQRDTVHRDRRRAAWRPWALLAFGLTAATAASAQGWGGAIGFASDNIERGYSLTDGNPAWLADLHYGIGTDWVVGVGASAERPPGYSAASRVVLYADRRWRIDDDWAAKIGIAHYDSLPDRGGIYASYTELNATVGYRGKWRMTVAASPDVSSYAYWRVRSGLAAWAEASLHQPLAGRLSLDAGAGYAYFSQTTARSHAYGSLGLSYGVGDTYFYVSRIWRERMTWTFVDGEEQYTFYLPAQARWVGSVVWSF
jgi:uncharacterized protein (TIGR02001 family)